MPLNLPNIGNFPANAKFVDFYTTEKIWLIEDYSPKLAAVLKYCANSIIFSPLKYALNWGVSALLTKQINDYNAQLDSEAKNLGKDVVLVDIAKLYDDVSQHPAKYDIKDPQTPCYYKYDATTKTG